MQTYVPAVSLWSGNPSQLWQEWEGEQRLAGVGEGMWLKAGMRNDCWEAGRGKLWVSSVCDPSTAHRITEWPGLKRPTMLTQFQPPAMCRVANQQARLPRATSSLALNACRDGAPQPPWATCSVRPHPLGEKLPPRVCLINVG